MKTLCLVATATITLAACGGSGTSTTGSSAASGQTQLPDASSYEELLQQYLGGTPGTNGVESPVPLPSIRTLRWPTDFPAQIQAGLTDTLLITGLQTATAYDFDVTLPSSVSSDESTLFVLNQDSANQTGSPVCYGDPDCTGTVIGNQVSLQLVSASSGAATLSIELSTDPALVSEGSSGNPVVLDVASGSYNHAGTVGATQAAQDALRTALTRATAEIAFDTTIKRDTKVSPIRMVLFWFRSILRAQRLV